MATLSWKTIMLFSILAWGLWGFLGKIVITRIGWAAAFALMSITNFALILALKPSAFRFSIDGSLWLGALMGVLGGVGTICFYQALESGPASVVVPGTALYIVVAAVLAVIFLSEALTLNRVIGIICGLVAIYFLSRG